MPKSEKPTGHERAVFAAEQRAARLRAEADRAERELAALVAGEERPRPSTQRVVFTFDEPVLALALTVTPSQLDMFQAIVRANGLHGTLRRRRGGARAAHTAQRPGPAPQIDGATDYGPEYAPVGVGPETGETTAEIAPESPEIELADEDIPFGNESAN